MGEKKILKSCHIRKYLYKARISHLGKQVLVYFQTIAD